MGLPPYGGCDDGGGLQEVETYISCHQNTVVQYIATSPIIDLCLAEKRRLGPIVSMWWWEQEGLDLKGMRIESHETERTEGEEEVTEEKETTTDD